MILPILPFLGLAICALPWLLIVSKRVGTVLGALTVFAATPTLLMLVFLVSPIFGTDPVLVSLVTIGLCGAAGLVVLLRDRSALRAPSRATLARWLPASIGGAIWLVTIAISRLIPGALVLSWAMNGDGSNHIHLARLLYANHGFTSSFGNSVPLADVLLTVAAWPGRAQAAESGLLQHDLVALGTLWSLAIAATGLLLGLVASSLLEGKRPLIVGIASAGGSLLVLTFFVTGLPIDSGYLNVHVALPFALATWLVFLKSRQAPVLATVSLFGFGFVLMAVWTPLIVFPASLIVALGWRNWSSLRVAKARPAIIIGAAMMLPLAYFVFVSLPSLLGNGEALTTGGHGFPFTGWVLLAALVIALVFAVALRPLEGPPLEGLMFMGVAALAGYGFLLYATFEPADPWLSYYPTKFLWMLTVVFSAVALSLVLRYIVERVKHDRARVAAVAAATAVAVLLGTLGPAPTRDHYVVEQPVLRVLAGHTWNTGESSVNVILAANKESGTVVLWNSGDPDEAFINFWVLDYRGAWVGESHAARVVTVLAYRDLRDHGSWTPGGAQALCDLVPEVAAPVTVYTRDASLVTQVAALCPTATVTVRTDVPPGR